MLYCCWFLNFENEIDALLNKLFSIIKSRIQLAVYKDSEYCLFLVKTKALEEDFKVTTLPCLQNDNEVHVYDLKSNSS